MLTAANGDNKLMMDERVALRRKAYGELFCRRHKDKQTDGQTKDIQKHSNKHKRNKQTTRERGNEGSKKTEKNDNSN